MENIELRPKYKCDSSYLKNRYDHLIHSRNLGNDIIDKGVLKGGNSRSIKDLSHIVDQYRGNNMVMGNNMHSKKDCEFRDINSIDNSTDRQIKKREEELNFVTSRKVWYQECVLGYYVNNFIDPRDFDSPREVYDSEDDRWPSFIYIGKDHHH